MQTQTLGHSSVQGGLRGHSIGPTYPITISYRGTMRRGAWYVWNTLTGEEYGDYKSASLAQAKAIIVSSLEAA